MSTYDDLWTVTAAGPQSRGERLPRRVKDWPEAAQAQFKQTKNELWKWAKASNIPYKRGLGLWAYQAVKEVWEAPTVDEWFDAMKDFAAEPTTRKARLLNIKMEDDHE